MLFALAVIFFSFLTLVVQTTLLPYIQIATVKPDLPLIVVMYAALYMDDADAMSVGFTFGIIQDSLSHGFFGLQATTKCLTVVAIIILKKIFYSEDFLAGYIISFIIIVADAFLSAYLTNALWLARGELLWGRLTLIIIYNALFVPPLFFAIKSGLSKYILLKERFSKI
ncbi:MAG: rod shape-determining protein MreD [Nitrospinota bacterium]|nr:rod shape-determining protein MreD [Nitrospinota bacterium]